MGSSLTKEIKVRQDSAYLPVIAVNAYAMPQDMEKTTNVFDAYLTKPLDFNELIETLSHYL